MSKLEEVAEEMFDCIFNLDYSCEYTDYFAERLEAARKEDQAMSEWGDKLLTEVDNVRLRSENEKLRKLVRHLWVCMHNEYTEYDMDIIASRCEDCEYDNDCGECDFSDRMRELGIEVNK